jgi:hypothetical protein
MNGAISGTQEESWKHEFSLDFPALKSRKKEKKRK